MSQAHGECRQRSPAHDANPGSIALPCPCSFLCRMAACFFHWHFKFFPVCCAKLSLLNPPGLSCNASPPLGLSYGDSLTQGPSRPRPPIPELACASCSSTRTFPAPWVHSCPFLRQGKGMSASLSPGTKGRATACLACVISFSGGGRKTASLP